METRKSMAEDEERKEKRADELKKNPPKPPPKMFRPKKFIVLAAPEGEFFYLDRDQIISIGPSDGDSFAPTKINTKSGMQFFTQSKIGVVAAVLNNELEDVFVTDEYKNVDFHTLEKGIE